MANRMIKTESYPASFFKARKQQIMSKVEKIMGKNWLVTDTGFTAPLIERIPQYEYTNGKFGKEEMFFRIVAVNDHYGFVATGNGMLFAEQYDEITQELRHVSETCDLLNGIIELEYQNYVVGNMGKGGIDHE